MFEVRTSQAEGQVQRGRGGGVADTYEEQQGGWCGWKEKVRGKGEAMRWRGSSLAGIGRGVSSGEESPVPQGAATHPRTSPKTGKQSSHSGAHDRSRSRRVDTGPLCRLGGTPIFSTLQWMGKAHNRQTAKEATGLSPILLPSQHPAEDNSS